MNIHANPTLTAAEKALVGAYEERFSTFPGDPAVVTSRDNAIEQLKAGLPTRRVESWHYTDLRRLLTQVPSFDADVSAKAAEALLSGSSVLAVLSGVAHDAASVEGLTVERLADLLQAGDDRAMLTPAASDDAIGAMNAAFASDGYVLTIADGADIAGPVELQNIQAGGQVHARFAVRAGKGTKATIVERQSGDGSAFVSSVSSLELGEGAEILWVIVQDNAETATHLGQFNAKLAKDAKLSLFVMNAGGKLVRQEIVVDAEGENSDFRLRGINLLGGETHCDVTMKLGHLAPHTVSTELIRNVVTDRAHAVFQGQIRVAQIAQKTDAKMACNTLLLSDEAEISTKPELEIFADDVACGHGATVTEIDRDHLFYLMARGVEEKLARGLLIKAFLAEVVEELENEELIDRLEEKLDDWFARHA